MENQKNYNTYYFFSKQVSFFTCFFWNKRKYILLVILIINLICLMIWHVGRTIIEILFKCPAHKECAILVHHINVIECDIMIIFKSHIFHCMLLLVVLVHSKTEFY